MRRLLLLGFTFCCVIACHKKSPHENQPPKPDNRLGDLKALYDVRLAEAQSLQNPDNGWLDDGCDGMIWTGRYATARGVANVNILAAEYPDAGKFGRRPEPWCWNKTDGNVGSETEWSRDMGVAGLFVYAWLSADIHTLQRHAAYGLAHNWQMADPVGDGRTVYSPQMVGLLYKAIHGLGGANDPLALWPTVWTTGLKDYEAHLQESSIFLQGRIALALREPDQVPQKPVQGLTLDISNTMYQRLEEHAAEEPGDPFYAFVLGEYTGSQEKTVTLLLDPAMPHGNYVRCGATRKCELGQWLFVATLAIKALEAVE